VSSLALSAADQNATPGSRSGTSMTKWQRRLRCMTGSARGRGELALGHGELLEVGADLRLPLAAQQAPGDVLELRQPHRELCLADDGQAALRHLGGLGDRSAGQAGGCDILAEDRGPLAF